MRLDYHGAREFYERNVEALVASASQKGVRPDARPAPSALPEESTAPGAASDPGVTTAFDRSTSNASAPSARRPAVEAYEPSSPEFGRYVRRLGPDADTPERHVVAFAFYLWNYERVETFGYDEIEGCLHAIGRTLPDDAAGVFEELTERKRFLESAGERRWRLTKKGENYVKSRLLTL